MEFRNDAASPSMGVSLGARGAYERRQREAELEALRKQDLDKTTAAARAEHARLLQEQEELKARARASMKAFKLFIRDLEFDPRGRKVWNTVDENFANFERELKNQHVTITQTGKEVLRDVLIANMTFTDPQAAFSDARVDGVFQTAWNYLTGIDAVTEDVEFTVERMKVHEDAPKQPTTLDSFIASVPATQVGGAERVEESIALARRAGIDDWIASEIRPIFDAVWRYIDKFFQVKVSDQQKREYYAIFQQRPRDLLANHPRHHDVAIRIANAKGIFPDHIKDSETFLNEERERWEQTHKNSDHRGSQVFLNRIRKGLELSGEFIIPFSQWDGQS